MRTYERNTVLFGLFCALLTAGYYIPAVHASGFAPRDEERTAFNDDVRTDPTNRVPGGDIGRNDEPLTGGFSDDILAEPEQEAVEPEQETFQEPDTMAEPEDDFPVVPNTGDEPAMVPEDEQGLFEQEPETFPETGESDIDPGTDTFEGEPGMPSDPETGVFGGDEPFEDDTDLDTEIDGDFNDISSPEPVPGNDTGSGNVQGNFTEPAPEDDLSDDTSL